MDKLIDTHPELCITAGELRQAGAKGIEPHVPDCAWLPRHSMRMGEVRAVKGRGPRGFKIEWDVTFTEPFRWVELTVKADV